MKSSCNFFSARFFILLGLLMVCLVSCKTPVGGSGMGPLAGPVAGRGEEGGDGGGMTAAHNRWRRTVGVRPLEWSETVAASARRWATTLARQGCAMEHSRLGYGENLAWFQNQSPSPAQVVDLWASERKDYDHDRRRCRPGAVCGHYTQILDQRSRWVGCARVACGRGEEIWVCQYDPPGNVVGVPPY
jgi:hypothetical protein